MPPSWQKSDLSFFSHVMELYDYQQQAIKKTIGFLYLFYNLPIDSNNKISNKQNQRKSQIYSILQSLKSEINDLGIHLKNYPSLSYALKHYYHIENKKSSDFISFSNFTNRAGLWMATGSGKSLVMIKLIEIITDLMTTNQIPTKEILVLTHRDDLINQIKALVNVYNTKRTRKIEIMNLMEFEKSKHQYTKHRNNIQIYLYRSDLIADETKEKLIGFEDIDNNGNWYLFLDEAHKGDKEDSKRQIYFSILTRAGFLFNFSATFTDPWDIVTTVFKFNLNDFISSGYGKNIYLSSHELQSFKKNQSDSKKKKQALLQTLIFLTYIKKMKERIGNKIDKYFSGKDVYHNPLLVCLVNSVNIQTSDLEQFFIELTYIASGNITNTELIESKQKIFDEFSENPPPIYGNAKLSINHEVLDNISMKDVFIHVFNAKKNSNIEVIRPMQNKEELIFKMKTSDSPFALMKIGDITSWIKNKLSGYDIVESFESKKIFNQIGTHHNKLNIVMGSRAFYEGWDSNRPNIMLFINIGGKNAKKFAIQSIGRGVRIEPISNRRMRLSWLKNQKDSDVLETFNDIKDDDVAFLETLFLFGTDKSTILALLKEIEVEKDLTLYTKYSGKNLNTLHLQQKQSNNLIDGEYLHELNEWIDDERVIFALEKIKKKYS